MTDTAGLSARAVIQLPITRQLAEQYLGNRVVPGAVEPFRLRGLCLRLVVWSGPSREHRPGPTTG